jgi:hypothetical protein
MPVRITRRPFRNVAVALVFSLNFANCFARGLTGGSYYAMYFYDKDLIIGSDSRISGSDYSDDDYCKLAPLSNRAAFFGIGITSKIGEPKYSADDIARSAYNLTGMSRRLFDVADRWGVLIEDALSQAAEINSRELIMRNQKEGNIVTGVFSRITSTEGISSFRTTVKLDNFTLPRSTFQKVANR